MKAVFTRTLQNPKPLITLLTLATALPLATAQDCKCSAELGFVVNYYEANLPGFKDNVTAQNAKDYAAFKKDLDAQAQKQCGDKAECFKILTTYVEFFKDNHSGIYDYTVKQIDETVPENVQAFLQSETFLKREQINPGKMKLPKNDVSGIENIYQTKDSAYTVAVVKSKTATRDYAGVIVESKTPLWKKGQVKFELKQTGENTYNMLMYMRNHAIYYFPGVVLENGRLANDWYNVNLNTRNSFNTDAPRDMVFREINATTNYMYIPTFSGYHTAKIHAFYAAHDSLIRSKPNLIIDVRNNGGGSDENVSPLLPYIYSKPFKSDNVDLYVTDENIRKSIAFYEENKNDTVNFDKVFMQEILAEIERMKSAPKNSFIPRSTGNWVTIDTVLPYPARIGIVANRGCASSCETLLFCARESDKTIMLGENSGGYVGYGEIGSVKTPQFNFNLGCTMTRYDAQRAYEVVGVPPQHYLDNNRDWLEQTLDIMNGKK